MKNLIVNADDFGRHELINRAVERAFEFGCLKLVTLNGDAKFPAEEVTT